MTTQTLERKAIEGESTHQDAPEYVKCANPNCGRNFPRGTGYIYDRSPEYCNKDCFKWYTE